MRTTRNGLHVMNALMQPSETGRGAAAVRGRQLASRLPAAPARFLRPAAVVAAAGLLVTALAPLTASASASRPSAAWRLGGPPVPVLRWRSCDGGFQCATARVPLDYRHPRGAAIRIAMMRHRATSPARRIGSLFFNSGGPSEQIDDFPAEYAGFPPAVRARFDILTFDPRGFGYSTAVRCFPTATAENQFLAGLPVFPVGPRQESAWERTWARFDALCAQRNGSLLDHDTTADVARDMDLLRQAVGDPVLNYVGLSYGSGLGATYANLFPARAGHLILDANLNPVAWTSGDGGLPASLRLGQDQASAASMRAFLDLCGTAPTTGCAFSAGTPAATRAKFAALLSRLRRHPVTIGTPPQAYTYADTVTAVPLGTVNQWQAGASLLQQLWAASASPAARAQTTALSGPAAASPAVYAGQEQAFAVSCAGRPESARPPRVRGRQSARLRPVGRPGIVLDVAGRAVRSLAGRSQPGPLHRPMEPAHSQPHPPPRQHRRPSPALPGLGRDVPRSGPRAPADRRRVRAHRGRQPEHLRHGLRDPLPADRRPAAAGNHLQAERHAVPAAI